MAKLGDLYFDVLLQDKTDKQIASIREKLLKKLKLNLSFSTDDVRNQLRSAISSQPFKVNIIVDQASATQAVQAALQQVGYNITGRGITAAQARAAKAANADALTQAKIQAMAQAAADKHALAQLRLANAQARSAGSAKRQAANISLVNGKLNMQVPLLQSLTNMARNYVGVFGLVSAVKSLYSIRAEFERQEVALRALMQSASQTSSVMNELQRMALRSPFKVSEIVSFTKQLSAFSIPNNELVDTTKRLADLSAGLGVDMSRIILAYGQVRAATVLRGQELRQFTEAGIPMVQALADNFTKLEGKVVSAGDVFERISKKMVTFEDVKKVLFDMTDEGGRFFNHQEKMVETLYGKIERMGDAWRVMMNELGQANDDTLKKPIDAITNAMLNWRSTMASLVAMMSFFGARSFLKSEFGQGFATGFKENLSTSWMGSARQVLSVERLANSHKRLQRGLISLGTGFRVAGNMAKGFGIAMRGLVAENLFAIIAAMIADIVLQIHNYNAANEDFANNLRRMGQETRDDLERYFKDNKSWMDRLWAGMGDTKEQEEGWKRLREQIEAVDKSGAHLSRLMGMGSLRERNKEAIELLDKLREASDFVASLGNRFGGVTQDVFHGWLGQGLGTDAKQLQDDIDDLKKRLIDMNHDVFGRDLGDLIAANGIARLQGKGVRENLEEFNSEVDKTVRGGLIPRLKQAFQSGLTDPAQIRQIVEMWRAQVLASTPELVGETLIQFDTLMQKELVGLGGALGDVFRDPDNFDMTVPVSVFEDFLNRLSRAAKDNGEDLRELVRNGSTDTIQELADKVVKEGGFATDEIRKQFETLAAHIEALQPRFTVRLNIVDETRDIFKDALRASTGLGKQDFDKKYLIPNGVTTDSELGNAARQQIAKNNKERKQLEKDIKRLEKQANNYQDGATAVNSDVYHAVEQIKVARERIGTLAEETGKLNNTLVAAGQKAYYGTGEDLDSNGNFKKTKNGGSRGGNKKDLWLENVKAQYAEIEAANKEIEKYAKLEGEAAAKARIQAMERFAGVNADYLGGGGLRAYINAILPDLTAHASSLKPESRKATNDFVKKLKDVIDADLFTEFEKAIKQMQDELQRRIDMSAKNWNLYDKIFEAIGDENKASLAAFGGKRLFASYAEQLKSIFNENGKISFADALGKTDEELKKLLGDGSKYIDLLKKIKDLEADERIKFIERGADAMKSQLDAQGKIAALEAKKRKIIEDTYRKYGVSARGMTILPPDILASLGAQMKEYNDQIAQANSESLKLSKTWESIFDDAGIKVTASLKKRLKEADDLLSQYDDMGNGKYRNKVTGKEITQETYKQIRDQRKRIWEDLKELDPVKFWKDTVKSPKGSVDWFGEMAVAVANFSDAMKKATDPMKDFFAALGNDALGDDIDLFYAIADGLTDMATGAAEIAAGNYVGGTITAVGGLFSSITSFFNFHDKRLDRIIERSKREVKKLENAYAQIEKALERTLGGIYASGNDGSYNAMLANLNKQYAELQKQRDAEADKKKKDEDALIDYDKQLDEMRDTIKHFAEDMADALYGINVKDWAKDLTDAVVSAWASGEDAVQAYRDKVKDIIKDVTTNVLTQKVMEAALQPVLDSIVKEMTAKEGKLDESSIMAFAEALYQRGEAATNTITAILEKLKEQGYDLTGIETAGTLGKGIQGMSEEKADLLGSYLNAMRADLAFIRLLQEQNAAMTSPIAMRQIQQMQQIADNTLRNAEAAERIEAALNSVIAVGASGRRLRV